MKEVDLLRLSFDSDQANIDEHTAMNLRLKKDDWWVSIEAGNNKSVASFEHFAQSQPNTLVDRKYFSKNMMTVKRILSRVTKSGKAGQGNYFIQIEGLSLDALVFAQDYDEFTPDNFERFLQSIEIHAALRVDQEVPPAWIEYQRIRSQGMPNGKFLLSNGLPVTIGDNEAFEKWRSTNARLDRNLLDELFKSGGINGNENLIQSRFNLSDDQGIARVDVFVSDSPLDGNDANREFRFRSTLHVNDSRITLSSGAEETYHLLIEPGEYQIDVAIVNRGKPLAFTDRGMFAREYFIRDDMERVEIYLYPKREIRSSK